jgi:hypothetical protein
MSLWLRLQRRSRWSAVQPNPEGSPEELRAAQRVSRVSPVWPSSIRPAPCRFGTGVCRFAHKLLLLAQLAVSRVVAEIFK